MLGGMGIRDRWSAAVKAWRLGQAVATDSGLLGFGFGEDRRAIPQHRLVELSTAVYSAVDLRSSALAAIPVKIRDNSGEHSEDLTSGPAVDLFSKVNPFWTWPRLLEAVEVSMCVSGQAFIVVEKDRSGTPVELWYANPAKMRVIPHSTDYVGGYEFRDGNKTVFFKPDEVVWIRGVMDPADEFKCLSPLEAARLSVESNLDAMESNRNIFRNGLNPGGILYPADPGVSLTRDQRLSLEEQINLRLRGKDKAHRIAVFSHPMKLDTPSLTPADAEFMDLLNWTLGDVARVYKIPPTKLQDFSRATYSNVEQADKAFYTDCIIPEARRIAAELNEQLLPMFGADLELVFDFSKIPALQEDQTEITTQMVQLASLGVPLNKLLEVYRPDLLPEGGTGYAWGDSPMLAPGLPAVASAPAPQVAEAPPPEQLPEPAARALRVIRGKA